MTEDDGATGTADDAGLCGIRVLDFSSQIAGPYCSKLFADGGADVIKVEPMEGDSLRSWSASGAELGGEDSALFTFLNAGKQAVVGAASDPHVTALFDEADLVIEAHGLASDTGARLDPSALLDAHPSLVVLSITPYGLTGPWAGRPATEFTLQAESGSLGVRGLPGQEPFQAGGRITEWAAGAFGAAAALPVLLRAKATGRGDHIDLSLLETANLVFTNFSVTMNRCLNGSPKAPDHAFVAPGVETPSIEPTADGYVGFCTNARQQFADFLVMIDRADLLDDEELAQVAGRTMRFEEWTGIVHGWCAPRTTAEIIEMATAFRVPVAPVCNGETVLEHEQHVARGVFGWDARQRFLAPRRPYLIDGAAPAPLPAPEFERPPGQVMFAPRTVGEEAPRSMGAAEDAGTLPLAGLRIVDLTAWWAGPAASHLLAAFGADVVHVESTAHPDGMRMVGGMMAANYEQWWDASPHFMHANTNKRAITLDLARPEGVALLERLIEWGDALLENFTPRVLEAFGLTPERIEELNPRVVSVRMPAFGLSGPWRDRPGFAQTVEQLSGLAWITGHPDDQPRIPRGPCDPIAGMHAAFALLVALAQRGRSGRGRRVEIALAEVALNVAAEQVIERSAYGHLLEREGNRSPLAAPQGLYPCRPGPSVTDGWMALSVTTDGQWRALQIAIGDPEWAGDPALDTLEGRRAAHDLIDARLREWTTSLQREDMVDQLRSLGIPCSPVADPSRLLETNPQFRARGYFETPEHPVVGAMPLPSLPFRVSGVDRWLRTPAPTLGEHNDAVLGGLLGLSRAEIDELKTAGVIGTSPAGVGDATE
ncbi:MAG: CoA transferase [Acidimicrobiales bacterium]